MGSHSSYIFSFRPSYSHQQPELQKPWSPHYKDKKKMKNSFNTALQVLAVLATLAALGKCVCDCTDWGPMEGSAPTLCHPNITHSSGILSKVAVDIIIRVTACAACHTISDLISCIHFLRK